MKHDLFIELDWTHTHDTGALVSDDKYPESLVRHFLKTYTKRGDKVFDPFSGFGTTLFVAEEMKRQPYGVEADRMRYEWSAGQLENWNALIHGDAVKMLTYGLPKMDFCITSPPYMPNHHKWNPLFGGNPKHAGYAKYLKRMALIFEKLRTVMKKNAYVVVQADNLPRKSGCTPLVHDFQMLISKHFRFEGETIVKWKNAKPDYPVTHCLIFKTV